MPNLVIFAKIQKWSKTVIFNKKTFVFLSKTLQSLHIITSHPNRRLFVSANVKFSAWRT